MQKLIVALALVAAAPVRRGVPRNDVTMHVTASPRRQYSRRRSASTRWASRPSAPSRASSRRSAAAASPAPRAFKRKRGAASSSAARRRLQRRRRQRGLRCQGPHGDCPQGLPRGKSGVHQRRGPHRLLRPRMRSRLYHKPVAPPLSLLPVWVESSPDSSSHSLTTRGSATTGRGPGRARAGPPCGCCGATASRRPSRRAAARSASQAASGRGPSRGSSGGPSQATRVPRATGGARAAAA